MMLQPLFLEEGKMSRLSFYLVDEAYCNYLRSNDPCVPHNMAHKSTRPFIGVLFAINGISYYAPLSSPKLKHATMSNQIDLIKVDGGKYGVINLNNMIPVHSNCLNLVPIEHSSDDSPDEAKYKQLLSNQLTWCNSKKISIVKQAKKLYDIVCCGKANGKLVSRCCKFAQDEILLKQYCKNNGWTL